MRDYPEDKSIATPRTLSYSALKAIEWIGRDCATCGREMWQRKQSDYNGVYQQNCPPCRQRMGQPTFVDWSGTEF